MAWLIEHEHLWPYCFSISHSTHSACTFAETTEGNLKTYFLNSEKIINSHLGKVQDRYPYSLLNKFHIELLSMPQSSLSKAVC